MQQLISYLRYFSLRSRILYNFLKEKNDFIVKCGVIKKKKKEMCDSPKKCSDTNK